MNVARINLLSHTSLTGTQKQPSDLKILGIEGQTGLCSINNIEFVVLLYLLPNTVILYFKYNIFIFKYNIFIFSSF